MKHNTSPYAICPFYHYYDGHKLCCEGVSEHSTIHLAFASPVERRDYEKRYCHSKYRECRVAQMLYGKYGGVL